MAAELLYSPLTHPHSHITLHIEERGWRLKFNEYEIRYFQTICAMGYVTILSSTSAPLNCLGSNVSSVISYCNSRFKKHNFKHIDSFLVIKYRFLTFINKYILASVKGGPPTIHQININFLIKK